jgi:hypothetical protein
MTTPGNDAAASLHCVAMRVTQLAPDGSTPAGTSGMYVTDSLIKIDFNPDIEAGPETVLRNASGAICVMYRLPDIIKRLTMSIQICTPDPELEQLLSGGTLYKTGAAVQGYQYPKLGTDPVPNGVSIEAWTHAIIDGNIDPTRPYMRWVFPRIQNLVKANRTLDGSPLDNTFNGHGNENSNWGNGPANDWDWDSTSVAQWAREATHPVPAVGLQPIPVQTP